MSEAFEVDPFPRVDGYWGCLFLMRIAHAARKPAELRTALDRRPDAFVWVLQNGLSHVIWESRLSIQTRVNAIEAVPHILAALADLDEPTNVAVLQFWNTALQLREIRAADTEDERQVADACFASLRRQILSPLKICQSSGLQGLRELGHPRTSEALAEADAGFIDAEVRRDAEQTGGSIMKPGA